MLFFVLPAEICWNEHDAKAMSWIDKGLNLLMVLWNNVVQTFTEFQIQKILLLTAAKKIIIIVIVVMVYIWNSVYLFIIF